MFEVCVCDPFAPESLSASVNSNERNYERTELTECAEDAMAPPAPYEEHLCLAKCKHGCTGVDCNCARWEDAGPNDLCTTAEICLEACDADAACVAFDFDELAGHCRLFDSWADRGPRRACASSRMRTPPAARAPTPWSRAW